MKRIKLTAARWHQKVEGGYIHRRSGDVIEVPDKDADRLIRAGAAAVSRAKLTDPDEAAALLAEGKTAGKKAIKNFAEIEDGKTVEEPEDDDVSDESEDTTDDEPATETTVPASVEDEDVTVVDDDEPATETTAVEKPAATDSTDVWRAYAVAQGMAEDEANNLNRTELRKHYS